MSAAPNLFKNEPWGLFSLSGLENGDIDGYLEKMLDRVASHFLASGATLFLSTGTVGTYVLRAKSGSHASIANGAKIILGNGIAGRILESKRPRILGNLAEEDGLKDLSPSSQLIIASSMIVPLLNSLGEIIGVLNVSRGNDQTEFLSHDLDTATGIASVVTLALTNATLVEQFVHRTKQAMASEEKLQAVFDSVSNAIIVFDRHNNIIECNAAANRHVNRSVGAWSSNQEFTIAITELLNCAQNGNCSNSVNISTSDGRSWMLTATPLKVGGAVVTIVDLTEAEKSVRESERLHRLAEIGQMTAALAHEIRNPLTGIKSAAQMIQENPETSFEFLNVIIEETMRLNNLCDEFLNFARSQELVEQIVCLRDIVNRVILMYKAEFDDASISLTVDDSSQDPVVFVDRAKIEQVLHNLVRNARQACKSGGAVSIKVLDDGFSVIDNGIGLTSTQIEKLFTPFFTTKSNGHGLGLCNVKNILDAHKATIQVFSEPGDGSTFSVRFTRVQK